MLRTLVVFLVALASTFAQGCIFADGFDGCPMSSLILSYGNYGYAGAQVIGSGSTPGFLSDPAYLFDGKPGTLTNIQWINGAQTLFSHTDIEFGVGTPPVTGLDDVPIGVVAVLNTDLPEGLATILKVNGIVVQISTMRATPTSTRTSCWFLFPVTQTNNNYVTVEFHNVIGGDPSPPMSASQVFTIGEIYAGNYQEFKLKRDPKFGYETMNKNRFSSAGVSWPIPVPPVRNIALNLAPLLQKETFTNASPLSAADVIRNIFVAQVVAVIPFTKFDPSTYGVSNDFYSELMVSQTAFLGQFKSSPTITGNGDQYYDISMQLVESV